MADVLKNTNLSEEDVNMTIQDGKLNIKGFKALIFQAVIAFDLYVQIFHTDYKKKKKN